MRIYRDRFYVLADHPGISGFKDYSTLSYCVVTGERARVCREYLQGEFLPIAEDYYRLQDGHLQEYQPVVRTADALAWLTANPFQSIVRLDPATRSKAIKPNFTT